MCQYTYTCTNLEGENKPWTWTGIYCLTQTRHPIKVIPAVDIRGNFMRPLDRGFRYYTIVPETHGQRQMAARYMFMCRDIA